MCSLAWYVRTVRLELDLKRMTKKNFGNWKVAKMKQLQLPFVSNYFISLSFVVDDFLCIFQG